MKKKQLNIQTFYKMKIEKSQNITITISGFKTKQEAISWLSAYEGSVEQTMGDEVGENSPSCCNMSKYIPEMERFKGDSNKINFNLKLS